MLLQLNCLRCKAVAKLNSELLKHGVYLGEILSQELRPLCFACRKDDNWILAGAENVKLKVEFIASLRIQEIKAAVLVQRNRRGLLQRRKFIVLLTLKRRKELEFKMSVRISSVFRGHLDRRRALCERCLRRMRDAHIIIFEKACEYINSQYRWEQLENNWRFNALKERWRIEEAIIKTKEKVHELECMKAREIERIYRGFIGRNETKTIRKLKCVEKERKIKCCILFQTIYRMYSCRVLFSEIKRQEVEKNCLMKYLEERSRERKIKKKNSLKFQIVKAYQRTLEQERTAKILGYRLLDSNQEICKKANILIRDKLCF